MLTLERTEEPLKQVCESNFKQIILEGFKNRENISRFILLLSKKRFGKDSNIKCGIIYEVSFSSISSNTTPHPFTEINSHGFLRCDSSKFCLFL